VTRIRVGLVFGGRSVEHDVSLVSARAVKDHLDPDRYEVVPLGVTRRGQWRTSRDAARLLDGGLDRGEGTPVVLPPEPSADGLLLLDGKGTRMPLDVIFPLVHGTGGEDGTMQGMLEMAGLPYVGSGVLASSLGMDKAASKRLFHAAGLKLADYIVVGRSRLEEGAAAVDAEITGRFGYPCFVKPSNGGSSVGVSKVKSRDHLTAALREAAAYDKEVIVEQAVNGQEVECAVLGAEEAEASIVGEIVPANEFYDYNAKYLDDSSRLIVPARLPGGTAEKVRQDSLIAFRSLGCSGMARVDFFVREPDGAVIINEINTIPGFTPISMYPRLWDASGIGFAALVDRLIDLAFQKHEAGRHTKREFAPGQKVPSTR